MRLIAVTARLSLLLGDCRSIEKKREVREENDEFKTTKKNNVRSTTKDEESPNTGHFWMNLIATKNEYRSRNFSKARITQEISKKGYVFFLVLRSAFGVYICHVA